jgi:hypothetical protein
MLNSGNTGSASDVGKERRPVSTADRSRKPHKTAKGVTSNQCSNAKDVDESAIDAPAVIRGTKGELPGMKRLWMKQKSSQRLLL